MLNIKNTQILHLVFCLVLFCVLALPATAQETVSENTVVDILPAKSVLNAPEMINETDTTHATLNLTPDKSELIRLKDDAASVIVGNPAHLSVLAESSKLLVFIPRMAGATYVTVLAADGSVIMQRHVIVASPKEKYIRIRSSCAASDDKNCQATQVYYCPDMCHAIAGATDGTEPQSTSSANGGGGNQERPAEDEEPDTQE